MTHEHEVDDLPLDDEGLLLLISETLRNKSPKAYMEFTGCTWNQAVAIFSGLVAAEMDYRDN